MRDLLTCEDERRRQEVRRKPTLNGLDYLEVSSDQRSLSVYFLDKAPAHLKKENFQIRGGRRVTGIRVVDIDICRNQDPERDDCLTVHVDKPGDWSCYELCVVALDEQGRPTGQRHPEFDPRYACLGFSFKAGCPSDLDCAPAPCPPEVFAEPEINYLAKDYATFRQLVLDRLALLVPEWRERHVPDLGITLVELLAYVGDHLSYLQDAVATEAYLDTARLRISVRRHVRLVDYHLHEGCNARTWVHLQFQSKQESEPQAMDVDLDGVGFVTSLHGVMRDPPSVLSREALREVPAQAYEWFERMGTGPVRVWTAHNEIRFYTWGDTECCLLEGATRATLSDDYRNRLHLRPGDFLLLEEVLGPRTGNPADADPEHRQVVRVTKAEPAVDPLNDQPIVEIEWEPADALRFTLCLSSVGPAPECVLLDPVSVARGNVVLVDHGRTVEPPEPPFEVPCIESRPSCEGTCHDGPEHVAGRFRPRLDQRPLTFREPFGLDRPASKLLEQDPRRAAPLVVAHSRPPEATPLEWTPVPDLIASGSSDAHFVVEVDDDGFAHLRFGDGDLGRAPEAGQKFTARYRAGSGPDGNVGAESIAHLVTPGTVSGLGLTPRNPMPARGGTAPEPVEEAKAFAPFAFREQLQRAVTPRDYAALAERDFTEIQRASARLRWTGSWYAVELAVDPRARSEADPALLQAVEQGLERYRRIAHDLRVEPAALVPLDVELRVCLQPHYFPGPVKAALLDRFSSRVLADGSKGFFHADNLSFGEGVFVSRLVAEARRVPGVENVAVTRLQRFGGPDEDALAHGVLKLAPFEVARLDNDPGVPENGVLRVTL